MEKQGPVLSQVRVLCRDNEGNPGIQRALSIPGAGPGPWVEHRFEMLPCLSL